MFLSVSLEFKLSSEFLRAEFIWRILVCETDLCSISTWLSSWFWVTLDYNGIKASIRTCEFMSAQAGLCKLM